MVKNAAKRKALKEAGTRMLPTSRTSPIRIHNRCKLTGRPKGYMRQFGISRVTFREMANKGLIPGVTKLAGKKNRIMYTDPIADYLTKSEIASFAGHRVVDIPASNLKKEITKILFDQRLS